MKKMIVSVLLIALVSFSLFAVTQHGSGTLNVYGSIGSGTVSFVVTQTNSSVIDLLGNAAIQPTGDGVVLGKWDFSANNQATSVLYTVTYSTTPLKSGTTEIAFEVIELDGTTPVEQTSNATTFTAAAGSPTATRNIAVRLEETVPGTAPAASNYTGTITINLTSGT